MNAINRAELNVLALDAQSESPANETDFQQGKYTSDTPSMASASENSPFPPFNAFPRGRWTASSAYADEQPLPLVNGTEAPLQALFSNPPETSMVDEATQRIVALLHSAAHSVQEIQLFDDLYEVPA